MVNSANACSFLVGLVLVLTISACTAIDLKQSKVWCIARPNASGQALQKFLDFACSTRGVECGPINPGGSCYSPDTLRSHASYALNLYYKIYGVCDDKIAITAIDNPSYGNCVYV